jgi:hypothetical protein
LSSESGHTVLVEVADISDPEPSVASISIPSPHSLAPFNMLYVPVPRFLDLGQVAPILYRLPTSIRRSAGLVVLQLIPGPTNQETGDSRAALLEDLSHRFPSRPILLLEWHRQRHAFSGTSARRAILHTAGNRREVLRCLRQADLLSLLRRPGAVLPK